MTPEARLTKQIMRELKRRGAWCTKIHGSASQARGLPDIIGCYRGRFIGLEVKLPGGAHKLSRAQGITLSRLRLADAKARIVRSTLDALAVLDDIDSELDS